MIKRYKIIIIIAILLISSGISFVFILRGAPISASEKEINDTDLPASYNQSIKTDKVIAPGLVHDSLYDHLSNRPTKVNDTLVHIKTRTALLSD